jgi:hypothetical protein
MDGTLPISNATYGKLIREFFPNAQCFPRDLDYSVVTENSLVVANRWILKELKKQGITYASNFDCDKYCIEFLAELGKRHRLTSDRSEGLALGMVCFVDKELGPHAKIWFLTADQEIKALETQTAVIGEFTKDERESAWCVI